MATGTVRLFHSSRHYAFIQQDSGGDDVFVPRSSVRLAGLKKLRKGQRVSFETFQFQGRLSAKNLQITKTLEDVLEDKRNSVKAGKAARYEMSSKSDDRSRDGRTAISRIELERALTETVKASFPECEALVGVIVEKIVPAEPGGANWAVRGIKYGTADRNQCASAIANCVRRRQSEFTLVD